MQILVVYDRKSLRAFEQDGDGTFLSSFAKIIEERLEEGAWYEGKIEDAAESLIDKLDELIADGISTPDERDEAFKKLSNDMEEFLSKRRIHENGDWDIVDTEN